MMGHEASIGCGSGPRKERETWPPTRHIGHAVLPRWLAMHMTISTHLTLQHSPIFFFPILHTQVFGNMKFDPDTDLNRHNNFQSFFAGLLLLFR